MKKKIINIAAASCMVAMQGVAFAGDTTLSVAAPASRFYTPEIRSYVLASNADTVAAGQQRELATAPAKAEFEAPLWTASNAHKYMGLGTLLLVAATALAPKPEECETGTCPAERDTSGPHQTLGRAAASMAAATVVSGLVVHWNDVHVADGFSDPDNQHAMLGTAGALLMLAAVSKAPGGGHAGAGMLGGIVMGAAVKITW